jgi:hypothetical protein
VPFDLSRMSHIRNEKLTVMSALVSLPLVDEQKSCQGWRTSRTSRPSSMLSRARSRLTKAENDEGSISFECKGFKFVDSTSSTQREPGREDNAVPLQAL